MVRTARVERMMLMRAQESSENVHRKEAKPIIIDRGNEIYSVAVLADGKHFVSGDVEGKIRRWRIKDGKEVGTAMDAMSFVLNVAVSQDGKWIVSGTRWGWVMVWNAETHSKVSEFTAHADDVRAVDVSPDATKIVTGSTDLTACVWSLSTSKPLLGPLKHIYWVVAAKFSPDGRLFATATYKRNSVRVYDSQNGTLLVNFPVNVYSSYNHNHSLAWTSDNKHLFVLSHGYIHRVDVSTGTTLSEWHIHSSDSLTSVALASNGTFIAVSAHSSVSFWDTTSEEQIGAVIEYPHAISSMAMSSNYDLVTSGYNIISLQALRGTLSSHYLYNVSVSALI